MARGGEGQNTLVTPPEGDSHIALIDLKAGDAESAVKAAWAAYRPDAAWPLKVTNDFPDKDGWTNIRNYSYQTSPNEKRDVGVTARAPTTRGPSSSTTWRRPSARSAAARWP